MLQPTMACVLHIMRSGSRIGRLEQTAGMPLTRGMRCGTRSVLCVAAPKLRPAALITLTALYSFRMESRALAAAGEEETFRRGLQLATRSAVSATLAFAVAQALGLDYPIFALGAAVIATDLAPARSRELGFRRLVATAIGGLFGALTASFSFVGIVAVGPSIIIAMLLCQGAGAFEGARVAGYICAIIVLLDNGASPWHYAFYRTIETALGVLLAWGISYVPKLLPSK